MGEVVDVVNSFQQPWQADIFVNNSPVTFKIDTRADVSVIPVKSFPLTVPRKVPPPLLSETKKGIDRMLELGVIRPVQEATDWCAPIVIIPKPNGKVRLCVDLTKLNLSVKREIHPLPSVDHILGKLGNSKVFSKLDANSAFWQRTLSESSQLLTTFVTPWGRYCFLRLPYGITTGSKQFQRCMAEKLIGLEGVECNIDDILIHGKTQEEHDQRLHAVLNKLKEAHITLNPDKYEFSKTSIKIMGHIVSSNGIKPDPEKIKSILNLPVPNNVAEIRSFLGMVS